MPSEVIFEMTTIDKQVKFGKNNYKIALHGPAKNDRENPHIHIYLSNDVIPYNRFNFEISLIDILCYDEINLIYQRDKSKGKRITNRNKCSWIGYSEIKTGFEDWLFENTKYPGNFKYNLEVIIWSYNNESNIDNALLEYIKCHGLKILNKYSGYFSIEDKMLYKDCFYF